VCQQIVQADIFVSIRYHTSNISSGSATISRESNAFLNTNRSSSPPKVEPKSKMLNQVLRLDAEKLSRNPLPTTARRQSKMSAMNKSQKSRAMMRGDVWIGGFGDLGICGFVDLLIW